MSQADSPTPRLTNLPVSGSATIRLPTRHSNGSPLTEEEVKTCVALLSERLSDPLYEPPGVSLTVMGKDGHPDTFHAVVYKTTGPKVFLAVEQYTYKPDKQEHLIGIGYEPLVEMQFKPRRLIQEAGPTPSVRSVSPSQPHELVSLVGKRPEWP